jgi:membrane protease YdiL (CAAX protease family)
MSGGAWRLLCGRAAYAALGLSLVLWAPIEARAPRVESGAALLGGVAAGALAFASLARRLPPAPRPAVARAVALAGPVVVVGAAAEEAVWRYGVLRGLEPALGPTGALGLSTIGFAAAHASRAPVRRLWSHVLTGATFGGVYLVAGRLAAPVAAHVAYNLLVVAACAAGPAQPEPAT